MGIMNLLKANWYGRVGETVGAKWKDKSTIRTYAKPSDPKTEKQEGVREVFGDINHLVALFSDSIKYVSALNTKGMSVRNAIVRLNKEQIEQKGFDAADVLISKGGLQKPQGVVFSKTTGSSKINTSFTAPTATNFTSAAIAVLVVAQPENDIADVATADIKTGNVSSNINFDDDGTIYGWLYFYDKRGTSKVASVSVESVVTPA